MIKRRSSANIDVGLSQKLKRQYTVRSASVTFELSGIHLFNDRKLLGAAARTITRPSEAPLLSSQKSPVRSARSAARLARQGMGLLGQNPGSQKLRVIIDDLGNIAQGELAGEGIHKDIASKAREEKAGIENLNFNDFRRLSKERLYDQQEVVLLKAQRDAKDAEKLVKRKTRQNCKTPSS